MERPNVMQQKPPMIFVYGAKILFRNFAGIAKPPYDTAGRRTFTICIPDTLAEALKRDGWYVGMLHPKDENDLPIPKMKVRINFDCPPSQRPPELSLLTNDGGGRILYDAAMAGDLDKVLFARTQKSIFRYNGEDYVTDLTGTDEYPFYAVDMSLSPYKNPMYNTGYSPYLKTFVGKAVASLADEIEEKYSEIPVLNSRG